MDNSNNAAATRPAAYYQILEAATQAFEDKGYQATTLDDIADAAGVSRRTIYHHFAAKHDILVAASLEQAHSFLQEMREAVPVTDDFPAFFTHCLRYVIEHAPASRFFMLQASKGAALESASVYFSHPRLMTEWVDYFQQPYIQALRKRQINPEVELEVLVNWFGRIGASFLQHPIPSNSPEALEQTLKVYVEGALRFNSEV